MACCWRQSKKQKNKKLKRKIREKLERERALKIKNREK